MRPIKITFLNAGDYVRMVVAEEMVLAGHDVMFSTLAKSDAMQDVKQHESDIFVYELGAKRMCDVDLPPHILQARCAFFVGAQHADVSSGAHAHLLDLTSSLDDLIQKFRILADNHESLPVAHGVAVRSSSELAVEPERIYVRGPLAAFVYQSFLPLTQWIQTLGSFRQPSQFVSRNRALVRTF